jgi:hypothetical protein
VLKNKDLENLRDTLPSVVSRGASIISSIGFATIVEKKRRIRLVGKGDAWDA